MKSETIQAIILVASALICVLGAIMLYAIVIAFYGAIIGGLVASAVLAFKFFTGLI